jgi:hypothetical protein
MKYALKTKHGGAVTGLLRFARNDEAGWTMSPNEQRDGVGSVVAFVRGGV